MSNLGDAPLEVIIGDGAGIDDNENADNGRDSAKRGSGSGGLSGIDGGDDTGLRKGSLRPVITTFRKGSYF